MVECRNNTLKVACVEINLKLLPVKATYFFMLAGVASLLPFLAVYMRQVGLSTSETAIIYGLMPFLGALVRPAFGAVADAWKKHKAVLSLCCLLTAVFHGLLLAVPHHRYSDGATIAAPPAQQEYLSDMYMNLTCDTDGSRALLCPEQILRKRGCVPSEDSPHAVQDWKSQWHFQNCSLKCRFNLPTDATKLCLHKDNETMCPYTKYNRTTFRSLPTIGETLHKHIFHHMIKNILRRSVFFELEKLAPVSTVQDSKGEKCYAYSLEKFLYNETEYTEGRLGNATWDDTAVTCDAKANLGCDLDCDVLPNITLHGFRCPEPPATQSTPPTAHFGRVFWMFFLIYLIAQIWFSPLFSLNDGIVYDHLGEERFKWGKQRLWGTIGFLIFAFISGAAMDIFSQDRTGAGKKNYAPAFILFVFNNVVAAMVVISYKISPEVRVQQMMKHVADILKKPEVVSIFVVVFIFGLYTGVIETFLYWHLIDLGAPQVLLGLCMVVNCLPEIGILFCASYILTNLGYVNAIYVVFMAYFVRMGAYFLITDPWYVLLAEPLHAITFGLMYAAVSGYASEVTPTGLHGTVQGIISALHFGFGKGVGALMSGWVLRWSELHHMFLGFSISALVFLVIYFLFNTVILRIARQRRGHRLPSHDTRDKPMDDLAENHEAASGKGRITEILDDFSVGYEKDKQALVFKDDPNT